MAQITVTNFQCYDVSADRIVHGKRPATYNALIRYCLTAIAGTEQEVDDSWVDKNGFLKPEYCKSATPAQK
ncbi:MAG: hypothetical protein H0U72_11790 [Nitrosospira sp.]|nr:hypothetical protein [Nitrosospira sp.]